MVPVALAFLAAAIDAISYLGLGGVFPANMTGNTVLLGVGVLAGDGSGAARAVVALAGFLVGATVAAAVVREPGWSAAAVAVLAGELVVLAVLFGWWLAIGEPAAGERFGLIALAGLAMGTQSAVVRRLQLGVTTTYITGTLTALAMGLPERLGRRGRSGGTGARDMRLAAVVVAAYLAGAVTGAAAFLPWGAVAVVVPLGVLASVIVLSAVTLRGAARAAA